MSVYKSKRGLSKMEYVENARKLMIHTLRNCVKFPKRYTYLVVQNIAKTVEDIDEHIHRAESITPTNAHEAQLRRDELTCALGLLNSLDSKLHLMYEIVRENPNFGTEFKWLPNAALEWGRLIKRERDLIMGVRKADQKRFKNKFKGYEDDDIQEDSPATEAKKMKTVGQASSTLPGAVQVAGSANNWWERSPNSGNSNNFCNVNSDGNANNNNASNSNGVAFGFCISIGQSK